MSKKMILVMMVVVMASLSFADIIGVADDQRYVFGSWSDNAGLSTKSLSSNVYSFVEFTLGGTSVTGATLNLYLSTGGTLSDTWEINATAADYDMTEGSAVGVDYTLWSAAATPVSVDASDNETYMSFDITSFYNANLGDTVTFNLFATSNASGDGAKFEDREGSMGTSNAAYIETVPEPATLLLLSGGLLLARRRRS